MPGCIVSSRTQLLIYDNEWQGERLKNTKEENLKPKESEKFTISRNIWKIFQSIYHVVEDEYPGTLNP